MSSSEQSSLLMAMVASSFSLYVIFRKKKSFVSPNLKKNGEGLINKKIMALVAIPVSTFISSLQINLFLLDRHCDKQGLIEKYRIRELDKELQV